MLLKEKKGILRMTEQSHCEIRKVQGENEQLQSLLRVRDQELDDIKFTHALGAARQHRKGCHSQQYLPF